MWPERGSIRAAVYQHVVSGRRKHRAATGTYSTSGGRDSYYASDDRFANSPRPRISKPTKPNASHRSVASASAATADGVPARASIGGKHRHHQAANYTAASISSSRLVTREPAVAPPLPHHRPPKPHKDNSAPSSSALAPPPQEPSEDELLRMGLEVASKMDMIT
jgi:hypothetical protein